MFKNGILHSKNNNNKKRYGKKSKKTVNENEYQRFIYTLLINIIMNFIMTACNAGVYCKDS